jgi:hypothetical protein
MQWLAEVTELPGCAPLKPIAFKMLKIGCHQLLIS